MKIRSFILTVLTFVALAAVGILMNANRSVAEPGSAPVTVINTPLPVTGHATVSGTVAATQSGPWAVGINGTPNVNIANIPNVNVANTSMVRAQQDGTWTVETPAATGHLANVAAAVQQLAFDNLGNLRVASPAAPVATRVVRFAFGLPPAPLDGSSHTFTELQNSPIDASGIIVGASHSFTLELVVEAAGLAGNSPSSIGPFGVTNGTTLSFPERLRIVQVKVANIDLLSRVDANVSIMGR